eukprot:484775_1
MLMMASFVFGGSEYCNTAYECVGQSRPINTTYTLYSGGYKANSGATTDITVDWNTETKDVRCSASFSCANIGSITGSARSSSRLFCDGAFSCSNTIVNLTGNIARNCAGSNSCNGVTFNSLNSSSGEQGWMFCDGDRSCANAEFHNHHEISALGSYALYNATIHSTADGFKVKLYAPNAGFGARIFCYLGHSCTIDCYVTGCHMLYIDCVGNCDIQVNSKDTVRPITDYSLFDASQLNILYDSSALEQSNDDACLFMVDNYRGHRSGIKSGSNVCCRGWDSCSYGEIISNTSVVCSGSSSCYRVASITANDSIFCSASGGCYDSNLYALNDVYCLGGTACRTATITARNLYCSGHYSCYDTT